MIYTTAAQCEGSNADRRKDPFGTRESDLSGPEERQALTISRKTDMMICNKIVSLAALGLLCAGQPALAQEPNSSRSLSIPTSQVKYKDLGGPQLGTVWGNSATGAHGSFLRLPKGFISP